MLSFILSNVTIPYFISLLSRYVSLYIAPYLARNTMDEFGNLNCLSTKPKNKFRRYIKKNHEFHRDFFKKNSTTSYEKNQ